ncbi:putative terminase small subunit [Aeromonas phage phiA8-29]|uniref:Putative terminase small subunit n=1 Tax=Aeromonas phage phiA8-29 TaxID=1978922 RepID=A0A1W6DYM1_9CAUD|nr:terminase small subunit [Aeromonas phage phiA8-29]ARK07979.1 putative terminase small subunit [Aeromonas phage phiA8-29]
MSDDLNERLLRTLDAIHAVDNGAKAVTTSLTEEGEADPMEAFSSEIPNVEVKELDTEETAEEETDLLKDYTRARNFTYAMQDVSLVMLKNLCQIAATTMHPKAYDSVNQMMSTMRGMNKDLMDFQKQLLESRGKKRTLPNKTLAEGETYIQNVVDEHGATLTISTRDRPTTTNILEVIRKAKEQGKDLSQLDNQMIVAEAELLEQDDIEEVDDGGSAEHEEGWDGSDEDGVQGS